MLHFSVEPHTSELNGAIFIYSLRLRSVYQASGVARTSPVLGHSMGILVRLYKLPRKVQKLLGGSGGVPSENLGILQPPRSVLRSYCSEAQVAYGRIAYMRLEILWIYKTMPPPLNFLPAS